MGGSGHSCLGMRQTAKPNNYSFAFAALFAILLATPARMLANPFALIFFLAFFWGSGLASGAVPLIPAHLAF